MVRPKLLILMTCSAMQLSMTNHGTPDVFGILDAGDYSIEDKHVEPALHSVPGDQLAWASYNRWLCFPAVSMKTDCRDENSDLSWDTVNPEERDEHGYFHVMEVEHDDHIYRFESPGWVSLEECKHELARTHELMESQEGVCVFASHWKSEDEASTHVQDELSHWVVYGLKTHSGRILAPIYDPDLIADQPNDEEE